MAPQRLRNQNFGARIVRKATPVFKPRMLALFLTSPTVEPSMLHTQFRARYAMQPQSFYLVVTDDFAAVDRLIREQLTSRVPLVETIGDYIISAGGKRLRPLLALLAANALGQCDERACKLAASIEFLHTSTLLHDDVVDKSDLRRGRATANRSEERRVGKECRSRSAP